MSHGDRFTRTNVLTQKAIRSQHLTQGLSWVALVGLLGAQAAALQPTNNSEPATTNSSAAAEETPPMPANDTAAGSGRRVTPGNAAGERGRRNPFELVGEAVRGSLPEALTRPRTMEEVWLAAGPRAEAWRMAGETLAPEQRAGFEFLLQNMPTQDLAELPTELLIENVQLAYRAWQEAPWKDQVSEELFLNYVLPYANINEQRDRWRARFYDICREMVGDAQTPALAAARLNQKFFPKVGVKYSTKRRRADQGPMESIESGLASCTGLSILLIDACRAVGIPARFVGTPLWTDGSGNHSWVEVWDQGWHFTGAAEPSGDALDQGWFVDRASRAVAEDGKHAIYAVSFRRTPIWFPLIWERDNRNVPGVNVTARYTAQRQPLAPGTVRLHLRVVNAAGERQVGSLRVVEVEGDQVRFSGNSKDERFDANDHLMCVLPSGKQYRLEMAEHPTIVHVFTLERDDQLETLQVP